MLVQFPHPYPDELSYSIWARYWERAKYRRLISTSIELFGIGKGNLDSELPVRLGFLIDQFPPGSEYTVDYFIDQHTLLPYYRPFLDAAAVHKIRTLMCGEDTFRLRH